MSSIIKMSRLVKQIKTDGLTVDDIPILRRFIEERNCSNTGCANCPFKKLTKKGGRYCGEGDYMETDLRNETPDIGMTNDLSDFQLMLYETIISVITAIAEGREKELYV